MAIFDETKQTFTWLAQEEGVNVSTVWRWAQRGVRGVKLESFSIGGRRFTTKEAFGRFVEASTAAANGEAIPTRTNRQREAAIARAEKECEAMGI